MARVLVTISGLVAATGGRPHGSVTKPLTAVTINSRALKAGDIFVAIKGERHDGHDFVGRRPEGWRGPRALSRA